MTSDPGSGPLGDASYRAGSTPGLTDFRPRSGGEGEVGALGIGTYWFAEGVNEITPRPRPASPSSTSNVETSHPLVGALPLFSCQPHPRFRGTRAQRFSIPVNHDTGDWIPIASLPRDGLDGSRQWVLTHVTGREVGDTESTDRGAEPTHPDIECGGSSRALLPGPGSAGPQVAPPPAHPNAKGNSESPPTMRRPRADRNRELRAWAIWIVGLIAFTVAIFHRTSLAVVGEAATTRFGIGAAELASFVSVQVLVYALMQVPTGVLLDRFGSRTMLVTGGLLMAAGQVTMAHAASYEVALAARVLVGAGDAMIFVSVLRLLPAWFPLTRVPLMAQLTGLIGQAGQILSAIPLATALARTGWTTTFTGAAVIGLVVTLVLWVVVRDWPPEVSGQVRRTTLAETTRAVASSFREPGTQLGLWTHFTVQFSQMVFALMWGYPFMTLGLGYSPVLAGSLLTLMVFSGLVAGPVIGRLSGRYPMRRSNVVMVTVAATVLTWTAVLLWPGGAPPWLMAVLVVVLSANGPTSMVGFDHARTFNPPARLGGATGIVNMGGFIATLITTALVGVILDLRGGGFTLADFRVALSVQYLLWTVGFLAFLFSRRAAQRRYGKPGDDFPHALWRHLPHRRPDEH